MKTGVHSGGGEGYGYSYSAAIDQSANAAVPLELLSVVLLHLEWTVHQALNVPE